MKNRLTQWLKDRGKGAPGSPPAAAREKPIRPEDFVGRDQARNEQIVREGFATTAKRFLRVLPMAGEVVAMYFCLLDSRTPLWVKGTIAAALAYFIMPIDAIPDILPVVGLSDDAGVLTAAFTAVSAHVTPEHRSRARSWIRDENIIDVTGDAV
jgi:uncharacterized membrane protein YkvA (DUF1232 family)